MKLNTLNTIIDDILLQLRNSQISESEHISKIQIEQWVHNYRAYLIKQKLEKGADIDSMLIQTIDAVHLDRLEPVPGKFVYRTNLQLPKLISFGNITGVVSVKDMFGNLIQLGSQTKSKYQQYRKYTCSDYIFWIKDNYIYVEGDRNKLEYITIDVIAENPADLVDCYNPNDQYPAPGWMIPTIKDLIFQHELRTMVAMPSDDTNDSKDTTQNIYKK